MKFHQIDEFVAYCTERRSRGRFGLDKFKQYMEKLGNPQLKLKVIHIAGTNGKGSTTNYVRSVLQHAGYAVGSFTSPHLVRHNDRIRINDIDIPDDQLLAYGNRYYEDIEAYDLSMFEIDVLIAVQYFLDQAVDYAVFEVGLGGRLDATNVVRPILSIITTIGYDHMDILGHTLEEIAFEKAGIIKPRIPVLNGESKPACLSVFEAVCAERQSPLHPLKPYQARPLESGIELSYQTYRIHLKTYALYQAHNASLAIEAALLLRQQGLVISDAAIQVGLESTFWKGRFEQVHANPQVFIDGAHNEQGIQALCETLSFMPRPIVALFSALKDKESDVMINDLLNVVDQLYVTEFEFYRAAKLDDLSHSPRVIPIQDPSEAIRQALAHTHTGTCIITGSLYFISLVREELLPNILKEMNVC